MLLVTDAQETKDSVSLGWAQETSKARRRWRGREGGSWGFLHVLPPQDTSFSQAPAALAGVMDPPIQPRAGLGTVDPRSLLVRCQCLVRSSLWGVFP